MRLRRRPGGCPVTAAIRVRGVGKEYRLGELRGYKTLRESLTGAFTLPGRGAKGGDAGRGAERSDDRIWALKDVSFDVEEGEVLGIIGHNGAGKTTLLKILSRITEPTVGEIELFGRVSSLLEVGTGFHPELTGRENIFLNGSILGMSRREIARKFDEIVDFSGVERFLDTPVKRYSSGMQVRLAFAVAAHLEPEILLVDEVLAVGDAEFQKKCLGKMGDIAGGGRTIVFVSHNMAAVENLCNRGILLKGGGIESIGPTSETLSRYFATTAAHSELAAGLDDTRSLYNHKGTIRSFRILNSQGHLSSQIALGEDVVLEVSGFSETRHTNVTLNIRIDSMWGQRVAACHTYYQHPQSISIESHYRMRCYLKNFRIMPGSYFATVILKDSRGLVDQIGPIALEVIAKDVYSTGKILPVRTGTYVPDAYWEIDDECDVVN